MGAKQTKGVESCATPDDVLVVLATGKVICKDKEVFINGAISRESIVKAPILEGPGKGYRYWGMMQKGDAYEHLWLYSNTAKGFDLVKSAVSAVAGTAKDALVGSKEVIGKLGAPFAVEMANVAAVFGVEVAAAMADSKAPGSGVAVKLALGTVQQGTLGVARAHVAAAYPGDAGAAAAQQAAMFTADTTGQAITAELQRKDAVQQWETENADRRAKGLPELEMPAYLAKSAAQPFYKAPPQFAGAVEDAPFGYADSMFLYEGAGESLAQGSQLINGGFVGGADCPCEAGWIGADEMNIDSVKAYANSINTKTKDDIIDRIIATVSELGFTPEGKTRAEKIRSIADKIPAGNKWKSSSESHKNIGKGVAAVINKIYGNKIIDETLPPELVMQQTAEIVASLAAGMHTEFLAVFNDVRKVLHNLEILRDSLRDTFAQVKAKMDDSSDSTIVDHTATLTDLHKIILDEVSRQINLLRNLLNVTLVPAQRDLAALIGKKKELGYYINKIDMKPGSVGFGKVITDVLNGLGVTANYALLVDRALKTVGLTMAEYAAQSSLKQLREHISNKLMGKDMSSTELGEYLRAAKLLHKNFYRKEDIAKVVKGSNEEMTDNIAWGQDDTAGFGDSVIAASGAAEGSYGESYEGAYATTSMYEGGAHASKYHRTLMDNRVRDRKKLKNLIFAAFYNRVNDIYNNIIAAMEVVSGKVGTEIPLSDQLDGFRHIIQRINDDLVRKKDIYYALIGYYNDALSRSKKDTLLGNLRMVSSYIDTVVEMDMYKSSAHYFRDIQTQIAALIEVIDKYSDEIASKFGSAEDAAPAEFEGGEDDGEDITEDSYEGGDDSYEGGDDKWSSAPKNILKSTRTITDAFRKFDYYYRVAQIKSNLKHSAGELDEYSAKYEKIIASSIADVLERHQTTYERAQKFLTDETLFNVNSFKDNAGNYVADSDISSYEQLSKERTAAAKFLEQQWDARKKFWAAVEAIDTYMRVFTDGLVKNPDDIKDIKSMLDEIEVINDWYNEATGNDISSVFDYFPSFFSNDAMLTAANAAAAEVQYPPESYITHSDSHYYKRIDEALKTNQARAVADRQRFALPGNPLLVTMPTRAQKARDQIKKTMNGLGVLKNLISVFVHIGSKFGGQEIRKKVFLTPTQIYNNLVEFLQASAFSQGFFLKTERTDDELNLPKEGQVDNKFTSINGFKTAVLNLTDNSVTVPNLPARGAPPVNTWTYENPGEIRFGITSGKQDNFGRNERRDHIHLFKRRWGVWMRSVLPAVQKFEGFGFKREDEYFVLILKSLAAKIFTVTGMYDVLDRPLESNSLSAVRMIIGGDDSVPKVIDKATELYLRLPLLAQFYRNIFGFDEGENSYATDDKNKFEDYEFYKGRRERTTYKISMVPDVDGTFSGLIRFIFRKAKFVQNNTYTLDDVKEIVREVNLIYQRMAPKHGESVVMETIHEFVAEVNRRYGIVGKSDRDRWEKEFGYRYDYASNPTDTDFDRYSEAPEVDIAILPGETDEEPVRPSAAEKLLSLSFSETKRKSLFTVHSDHKRLVYNFRCAIDRHFERPNEEYTFKNAIKMTQTKLFREQSDEKRLDLVAALVRGVDIQTKTDGLKYVMFHETVVSGLNTLSAIHTLLQRFKRRVLFTDLQALEDQVWKYLDIGGTEDGTAYVVNHVTPKYLRELKEYIADYFKALRLGDNDETALNYADLLIGRWRNITYCGGNADATDDNQYRLKAIDGAPAGVNTWSLWDTAANTTRFGTATPTGGVNAGKKVFLINNVAQNLNVLDPNSQSGLASILAGSVLNEIRSAHRSKRNTDARRKAETFFRFLFDREYVMKELVESVFGISSDLQGLVTFQIENGKLLMSFGGLKKLIEELFLNINGFIDILRPHIHPDIIQKYTAKTNPGSFYWLHEQLMEKIIVGRPPQYVVERGETAKVGYTNLEGLAAKLNSTYQILTQEYDHDGAGLRNDGQVSTVHAAPRNRTSYDKVFAEMIFYDAAKPGSGLAFSAKHKTVRHDLANRANHTLEALNGVGVVDYKGVENPFEQLHFTGPMTARVLDTRYIARFKQLYTWDKEVTPNRSAMFSFNQLVAKFIYNFFDPSVMKMYNGLLAPFTAGVFNRAINDLTYTYPDTLPSFYFPPAKAEAVKHSNLTKLEGFVRQVGVRDILNEAIDLFLEKGKVANPIQSAATRRASLDPSQPGVRTMEDRGNVAAAQESVTYLAKWLTVYVYAVMVKNLFMDLDTYYPRAANYALIAPHAGPTGAANISNEIFDFLFAPFNLATQRGGQANPARPVHLDGLINLYAPGIFGRVPTIDNIVHMILGTNVGQSEARASDLFDAIIQFGGPAIIDINTSLLTVIRNDINTNLNAGVARQANRDRYADAGLVIGYMMFDVNNVNAPAESNIVLKAAVENPFATDMHGTSDEERHLRTTTLANLITALAEAAAGGNAAAYETIYSRITNLLTKVPEVYVDPPTGDPKIIASYDQLITTKTDELIEQVGRARNIGGNLRLVSHDADAPFITGNPWRHLKGGEWPNDPNNPRNPMPYVRDRADIVNFGRRYDPDSEHVLFTSLAVILRNIFTSRSAQNNTSTYLVDNVADVNMYMKEKMRANLPAFKLLLQELNSRCVLLRLFLSRPEINISRRFDMIPGGYASINVNPWPWKLLPPGPQMSSHDAKNRFDGILDSIQKGIVALVQSCEQTLREVGDEPKYFETSQNFIKDYKQLNGFDPLMPLSSTLSILKNIDGSNYTDFLPVNTLGDPAFKFAYGTRLVLSQPKTKILAEHLVGWHSFVSSYNLLAEGKNKIENKLADSFASAFVRAARFIFESRFVKGNLTPYMTNVKYTAVQLEAFTINSLAPNHNVNAAKMLNVSGAFTRGDFVVTEFIYGSHATQRNAGAQTNSVYSDTGIPVVTNASDMSIIADHGRADWRPDGNAQGSKKKTPIPAYSVVHTMVDVISMTESSFKDDKYKVIVAHLTGGEKDSVSLEIQNIIDLNIVPINVHALMREVPLANLYNYGYSFDRMIIELYYGLQNENARKLIAELCAEGNGGLANITNAKDMLVQLLINPYKDITAENHSGMGHFTGNNLYERYGKRVLVGATGNELGRPKFLSDQLFNKALFGEIYESPLNYQETGPQSSFQAAKLGTSDVLSILSDTYFSIIQTLSLAGRFHSTAPGANFNINNRKLKMMTYSIAEYMIRNPFCSWDELHNVIEPLVVPGQPLNGVAAAIRHILKCVAVLITAPILELITFLQSRRTVTTNDVIPFINRISLALYALRHIGEQGANLTHLGLPNMGGGIVPNNTADAHAFFMNSLFHAPGAMGRNIPAFNTPMVAWAADCAVRPIIFNETVYNSVFGNFVMTEKIYQQLSSDYMRLAKSGDSILIDFNTIAGDAIGRGVYVPAVDMQVIVFLLHKHISYRYDAPDSNAMTLDPQRKSILHWLDQENVKWTEDSEPGAILEPDNENVFNPAQIKAADVSDIGSFLHRIGRLRFDSIFIRNLIFIVNLYRSVRYKLSKDLTYSRDIILKSAALTRPDTTEFRGNSVNGPRLNYSGDPRFKRYLY